MNAYLFSFLRCVVVAVGFATSFAFGNEPQQLKPVDEGPKDSSFFIFRASLMQAVVARDSTYLLGIVSPDILNSFGGDGGIAEFREMWKPEDAKSGVWKELAEILSLGGKFDKAENGEPGFTAPYVTICFPNDLDVFETAAIVGENVRLRKEGAASAEIVGFLSWDIVKLGPDSRVGDPEVEWIKVSTLDGRKAGYVSSRFVRSAVGLRAGFSFRSGKWVMTMLVGGD